MISIVIPTYKNISLLVENLTKNERYFKKHEVIIVNDDPSASISDRLRNFHNIVLIENGQNLGFGDTVNKGVRAASNKYVMILNSDVILRDSAFEKIPSLFTDNKKLFAVSFAQTEKNNATVGRNTLFWKNGFLQHSGVKNIRRAPNAWAEGGCMLVDKTIFEQLRGFNSLFYPFYWEDIDLSYRAWKQGYEIIFDPAVNVIHHHESTIGKYFEKNRIKTIAYRNQLIFIWKNITDKKLILSHLAVLPKQFISAIIHFDGPFMAGFLSALIRLPAIYKERRYLKPLFIRTDYQILTNVHEKQ